MNLAKFAAKPAIAANEHQARVDRIVAQTRADLAANPAEPVRAPAVSAIHALPLTEDPLDRRLAEEIDYVRRHLDALGEVLSDNGYLLHKHMRELQSLDRVNQLLAHIGRVISAQDRRQAAAAITLEDLRARLLRTGIAEDPVPPVGH